MVANYQNKGISGTPTAMRARNLEGPRSAEFTPSGEEAVLLTRYGAGPDIAQPSVHCTQTLAIYLGIAPGRTGSPVEGAHDLLA